MTDPVSAEVDAGLVAAADAYMYEHDGVVHDKDHPPLFVRAADRWPKVEEPWTETPLFSTAALLSERQRGETAMRERVLDDLITRIEMTENRIRANPYEQQDRALLEERVLTLDAARTRIRSLSLHGDVTT